MKRLAVLALGACSSFGTAPERTPVPPESDAGVEAGVVATDAGIDAAASSLPTCGGLNCFTFDDDAIAPPLVVSTPDVDAGSIQVDKKIFANGSGSLRIEVQSSSADNILAPSVGFGIDGQTWTKLRVDFSFRLERELDPGAELHLIDLTIKTGHELFWAITATDSGVAELLGDHLAVGYGPAVAVGTWTRFHLSVDRSKSLATMQFDRNGASETLEVLTFTTDTPVGATLAFGVPLAKFPKGGATVWYDDVQISTSP